MQGEGGVLLYDTIQIGTLGRWRLGTEAFSATGCEIASFWVSAGVARLCARPHANGKPKLWRVEGAVEELSSDRITLHAIRVFEEGAAS
jgi:hypothetical protein